MELYIVPKPFRVTPSQRTEEELPAPFREAFASFTAFLDPDRLQAIAEDLGCTERNRKIHMGMLTIALVLAALKPGADTQGRWLDTGAIYQRLTGKKVSQSALGDRIRALGPVLHLVLQRRVRHLAAHKPELHGRLKHFADVVIPDGCAFKIAAAHAATFPGTSNPAEFKLHAVYSVSANGLISAATSAGSVHDNEGFKPATWQRETLYIWDLGYQDYDRFVDAVLAGAVPLQRLKDKANPVVLAWYDAQGERHPLRWEDGRSVRLSDACALAMVPSEGTLDLEAEIADSAGRKVVARVVCVPFEGNDRWYLTTLPRAVFTLHDVAELYRLRWEVELFFRTLRGAARLDDIRRMRHPEAVTVAILSSMVAVTLGQELTVALNAWEDDPCESLEVPPSPCTQPQPPSAATTRAAFPPSGTGDRRRSADPRRSA